MYLYIWDKEGEIWKTLGPLVLHCWPNVCNAIWLGSRPVWRTREAGFVAAKAASPMNGTWACWWKTFVKAFRHSVGPLSTLWVWKTLETTPCHLLLKKNPAYCRIAEPNSLVSRKHAMGLSSLSPGDPDQPCTEPVSEQEGGEDPSQDMAFQPKKCGRYLECLLKWTEMIFDTLVFIFQGNNVY